MAVQRLAFSSRGAAAGPAEARRLARWWDEHQEGICGVDIQADLEMPFATGVEWLIADGAALCRAAGSITGVDRRQHHLARDGDDRISFVINRGARQSEARIGSQSVAVAPGSAILFDLARPPLGEVYPRGHEFIALFMPRRLLRTMLATTEDLSGALVPAGNQALRLLGHYAGALLDDETLSDPAVLVHAGRTLLDLAVLAIGTDRDNSELARLRGLRAARFAAVLRTIRRDYADPEMSPTSVAGRIGISIRYLRRSTLWPKRPRASAAGSARSAPRHSPAPWAPSCSSARRRRPDCAQ